MRRFLNGCGRHRADLCLVASGALADGERAALENHLASCAGCRKYFAEVTSVTAPLANWEKTFSHIEPDTVLKSRWEKDFQAIRQPVHPARIGLIISFLGWCHDMIWPYRRIWTGFAAIWLTIFAINCSMRENPSTPAIKSSRPSLAMVRAYLEGEGFLVEWTRLDKNQRSRAPKQSMPAPRSQRRLYIFPI
jgi:hypothetical protein